MKLISVNVAQPKVIIVGGRRVRTGIFKTPVAGPVKVGRMNLDGDAQADLSVHGGPHKAVYAYSWKNVEFWRRELGRDDLGPGSLGENLTLDDLPDTEISIGDELEIGTARFLVTQPRLPCYKLGIALGLPDFPKMFHRSGRNGFYLRVLREGVIAVGDEVRRTENANIPRMTVAEFVRIATRRTITAKDLERIRNLKALPDSWKRHLKEEVQGVPA
ncbi:MAG: MOSC domain-containing protein [Acidobacteria bacterium]|nr:MOSC domain-containing protein [Acidobacteriota bacterium]